MATALELKHGGWRRFDKYSTLKLPANDMSTEMLKERKELLERVRRAAGTLKTKFGVKRVILIGSLAHDSWFTPDSDIDIVVEGLSTELYWKAWKIIEEIIENRLVDLIDIENASPPLKRAAHRYGIEL